MEKGEERTHSFSPCDGSDAVAFGCQVAESRHLTGGGRPEVDAGTEADAEHVLRRPID